MRMKAYLEIDASNENGQGLEWKIIPYVLDEGKWIRILDKADNVVAEIPIEEIKELPKQIDKLLRVAEAMEK